MMDMDSFLYDEKNNYSTSRQIILFEYGDFYLTN